MNHVKFALKEHGLTGQISLIGAVNIVLHVFVGFVQMLEFIEWKIIIKNGKNFENNTCASVEYGNSMVMGISGGSLYI